MNGFLDILDITYTEFQVQISIEYKNVQETIPAHMQAVEEDGALI